MPSVGSGTYAPGPNRRWSPGKEGSDGECRCHHWRCLSRSQKPCYSVFFCSTTAGTIASAHKRSRNGPETVLFWSRRVGAGDVHSRPDRTETLVASILRNVKALPQQQEGAHDACLEHTPYWSIRVQSPPGVQ